MRWHRWCGYSILVLLVFRLLWGLAGSPTARFSNFIRSPWAIWTYVRQLVMGRAPHYLGHNPVGAVMIVALLALLAAQSLTGLFTSDSNAIFGGPFAHFHMTEEAPAWKAWLQSWHHLGANLLLVLIGLHVAVNLFCQFVRRDLQVTAMVTGVKPAGVYVDGADVATGNVGLRSLVCLAVAAVLVVGGIMLAGGNL